MPYLGIFEIKFQKNYCHISKYYPRICLIAKFHTHAHTQNKKNIKICD